MRQYLTKHRLERRCAGAYNGGKGVSVMLDMIEFGKRLKAIRRERELTQKVVANGIRVSEQAISKWEKGECLPDLYHLMLLSRFLRVSADKLLDTCAEPGERIVRTIKVGNTCFEVVEKPETILAGRVIRAADYEDMQGFDEAICAVTQEGKRRVFSNLREEKLPVFDINLSVNFWWEEPLRAYGFVREVGTAEQPEGVDVYRLPASQYIRVYTDRAAAQLIAKVKCEVWEMFAYIRNFLMPAYGFVMADNGAQEMEIFDSVENGTGYAYMPVKSVAE